MAKRVLIFPAGMPRSLAYLEKALAEGEDVIGSSSLGFDPAREKYPLWAFLPYVSSNEFDEALRQVIDEFDIGGIFTPNPVVWDYLNRKLPESFPGVRLVNGSPVENEMASYHKALEFARAVLADQLPLATCQDTVVAMSVLDVATLFRHAETIPGMCDHEKIRALCDVMRYCPPGDVVEIGSWWGKSAFVLLRLAQLCRIGKLLFVDPWSNAHLIQNDEKGLLDHIAIDADEALTVFQLNLLPYTNGDLNYLRLPSVDAASVYGRQAKIATPVFGETVFQGQIALLHIDGNHSYADAKADVEAWSERVLPGGWMVVDDYIWPYGDGPKRAGDEYLADHAADVQCAFVMGSALFVQKR